jgi:hypothetical protein
MVSMFAAWSVTPAAGGTSKTFVVTSAASAGPAVVGTLTWAIYQANYQGGDINYINFNIPRTTDEVEIILTETLYVARPMVIDAATEPGYAGQPLIRINCNGLDSGFNIVGVVPGIPPLSDGAPSTGGGSTIQGLRMINYSSNGIDDQLQFKRDHRVAGRRLEFDREQSDWLRTARSRRNVLQERDGVSIVPRHRDPIKFQCASRQHGFGCSQRHHAGG